MAICVADRVVIGVGYDALKSQFQTTYVFDTLAWGREKLSAGLLYATAGYQAPVLGKGLPWIGGAVDLGLLWAWRETYPGDTMAVRYSGLNPVAALRLKGIVRQVIWRGLEAQIEGGWSWADFEERIDYFENFGGHDADAWYSLDFDGPFVTLMIAISRSTALRDSKSSGFIKRTHAAPRRQ